MNPHIFVRTLLGTLIDLVIVDESLDANYRDVYNASIVTDWQTLCCCMFTSRLQGLTVCLGHFVILLALQWLAAIQFHNIYRINEINGKINCFKNYLSILLDTHAPLKAVAAFRVQYLHGLRTPWGLWWICEIER